MGEIGVFRTAIGAINRFRLEHPIELERRLARALADGVRGYGSSNVPFKVFAKRPAVETALSTMWQEFVWAMEVATIDSLADALLGHPATRRRGPSATERCRDGTRSVFPDPADAEGWLDRIKVVENMEKNPFAVACFAYAQTVLSHPYADGNGRLARVMFQRSLARSGLLDGPLLPLGPLVYASHRVHDRALQHLGATGDWGPVVRVLTVLTRKAAAFVAHVARTA